MADHFMKFVPVEGKAAPIEIRCSCGAKLDAYNGTDAMRIAKIHIDAERAKETESVTQT